MADFRVSGTASLDPDRIIEDVDMILEKLDEMKDKIEELSVSVDELSGKRIDIAVNIRDEDKLIFLRDLIDDLDSRVYVVDILVDIHGQDKIDDLELKVDKLDAKRHTVGIDVDIKGAVQATTELEALDRELNNKEDDFNKARKSADGFQFSIMSLLPLFTALIPIIAVAAGGLMGLAGAFAVMLPGIVGIALAAKPAFTAIQNLTQSLDQNTKNALANANSYDQIYKILNKNSTSFRAMSGDMQAVTIGWFQLQNAYSAFQKAVDPAVFPMLEQGMELLRTLLSGLPAIVNPAADAIQSLFLDFENRLHDPVFQSFFSDMKKNMYTFVSDWGEGILNIIEGITALLHAFMPVSLDVSGGFLRMTQSFDQWAQKVGQSKGFQDFIAYVQKNGPVVMNLLGQLVKLLVNIGVALSGMGQGSLGIIDHLVQGLNHLAQTSPGLFKVVTNVGLLGVAAAKLGPMLGPLIEFLATPEGAIVAVIVALAAGFIYLYDHSKKFRDWVTANLLPMWNQLVQAGQQFVQWMKGLWQPIEEIWQRYGNQIEGIIKALWDLIVNVIKGAIKIIEGIIDTFLGLITGDWSRVWKGIGEILQGAWDIIKSVVVDGIKVIVNLIEAAGKMIWGLVNNAWDSIGKAFKEGFDYLFGLGKQMWKNIIDTAIQWGKDILNAIETSWKVVNDYFGGIPGKILNALGNLGSLLWDAGKQIIQGLIDGIKSMVPGLSSVLNWITSIIPFHKGPPSKDKMLLHNSGQLIMQGLIDGLESKYSAVHGSLDGFTKSIGSKFGQQYVANISARINAAAQDANYAVNGYNQGGALPAANNTQLHFAAGAFVIQSTQSEKPSDTITRVLQGAAKFGTIQAPVGYSTRT